MSTSLLFNPLIQAAEESEAKTEILATPDAIWQSIDKQTQALATEIQANKLDEVHHHAFAIRDLAAALPERSKDLPADKLTKVNAGNKFVAILAERLDASGDAKDKAATEANFEKLQKVLKSIQQNYSGVMPSKDS